MPQQVAVSVENNFTKGLITEATGLNFPENAATECNNCEFTLIGDVTRRLGINNEVNGISWVGSRFQEATASYIWNDVSGNGNLRFLVQQIGAQLFFYNVSNATTAVPISSQKSINTVFVSSFVALGNTFDATTECQFADGNGYLFVFHPSCDPFYINYVGGGFAAAAITLSIRDFAGVNDGLSPGFRPAGISYEHMYNLLNQGWISGQPWFASSTTSYPIGALGSASFQVASGITGIVAGQITSITYNGSIPGFPAPGTVVASGTVTSYTGTTLTINITSAIPNNGLPASNGPWSFTPTSVGFINTFATAANAFPSNSDVWWYFKDNTGVFNPGTTLANTSYSTGNAPNGHYLMSPFIQNRSVLSGQLITSVVTQKRPSTGAWFQGRVWYSGVNDNFPAQGDAFAHTWTEEIYFSQIIQTVQDFGNCYQVNDPTSENLNGILPTDGGVIRIIGCGTIYKLFPIANGLIVFAANGVYFITGSQGIGFAANDYTVTTISNIQSISGTSVVNVQGLPYFWNEEGIYKVSPSQNSGLIVEPITVGTIQTFYNNIPKSAKQFVRGAYNTIDYTIQWIYKTTEPSVFDDRYSFDGILNYNVYNQAFFPYTVDISKSSINSIQYITSPTGAFEPAIKYLASFNSTTSYSFFIADENDTSYKDWNAFNPTDYQSSFTTGFKLRGQGIKKYQPQYIQMYSRTNGEPLAYYIQGIWDYASTNNSGKLTNPQNAFVNNLNFGVVSKRHKIRGRGYALQIQVFSQSGMPFDIIGWAVIDNVNAGA